MSLGELLHVLWRRFWVVVLVVAIAAAVGWVTAPGEPEEATTYRATHTLLFEPASQAGYNIDQIALLATSGTVPSRVATRLGFDRQQVRSQVSAQADSTLSLVSITARSSDRRDAARLAETTADELADELLGERTDAYEAEVQRLSDLVTRARNRVETLEAAVAAGDPGAGGELSVASSALDAARQAVADYQTTNTPEPPLRTLEGTEVAAVAPAGVQAPDSEKGRALLLGALGIPLGIGIAFVLHGLDTRLRSKQRAEEAFGFPVVAEIPALSRSAQRRLMRTGLGEETTSSAFLEAYRGLRTIVALDTEPPGSTDGGRVILVTSPGAGEGKTTTVAHVAAMLAEVGRSVILVSADFRRPRLHLYFDRPREPGLAEALSGGPDAPTLAELDLSTSVDGVRLLTSGAPIDNPAPILDNLENLLRATRRLADFVIVDSPPLLMASDSVALTGAVDAVLVIARAGRTSTDAAQRTAELLRRIRTPVIGVVLVASEAAPSSRRYYRSRYYYAETQRRHWYSLRRSRNNRRPGRTRRTDDELRTTSSAGAGH